MADSSVRKRKVEQPSDKEDLDILTDSSQTQNEPAPATTKDETPEFMKEALKDLPPKWKNWWVRGLFTIVMFGFFAILIYIGPIGFMFSVILCQVKCFHEIITIGHQVYKSYDLPWFRTLSWYFLICSNYFFYGETLAVHFSTLIQSEVYLTFLAKYHRMISYMGYLVGFMLFVLSLVKKRYRLQFFMFGWTHVTLLIIVTQSHLLIQNMLEGLVWLIVPVSMVICNDIMAYICGFFFGRTPLIKLSPKKTWEGFIGGAIFTVIFGWFLSGFLSQFPYLTCPSDISTSLNIDVDCKPLSIFVLQEYDVPLFIRVLLKMISMDRATVNIYPFQLHCLSISIFSSSIAPFGGFFASGFKRAFKIKDFGDIIPGHGGLMDRFDCQYLMATFVNVYLSTFIKIPSPQKILPIIAAMNPKDQLALFEDLKTYLTNKGLVGKG
uniref:Phosphatidate cytidylyltransferase n=1 Tax=Phallusia mammillata TaxID=59560 RepID=A0A6F9D884_9ASCI|nr:phosphatidate cytidylyltransferase 2-like [Phallusia mammillata]